MKRPKGKTSRFVRFFIKSPSILPAQIESVSQDVVAANFMAIHVTVPTNPMIH